MNPVAQKRSQVHIAGARQSISAEQWIRNNRNRWIYFVVLSSAMLFADIANAILLQSSKLKPTWNSSKVDGRCWQEFIDYPRTYQ
jgi:hypothetical protein